MTMTNLDAEIAKAKKQAADRIRKLKREAAVEQRKIDAKVVELLREQDPDRYDLLAAQASDTLAAARAKRSGNARRTAPIGDQSVAPDSSQSVSAAVGLEA